MESKVLQFLEDFENEGQGLSDKVESLEDEENSEDTDFDEFQTVLDKFVEVIKPIEEKYCI